MLLVLPAFNEEVALPSLLSKVKPLTELYPDFRVLVVDDGSTDRTSQVVSSFQGIAQLILIRHEQNQGLGKAIQTGLRWAVNNCRHDEIIITMDADDTHEPNLIPRMVDQIRQGSDVVIASRYQLGGEQIGLALHRRILSWGASALMSRVLDLKGVKDYSCGYRAYRAGILKRAFDAYGEKFIETRGFDCMVEILLKLRSLEPSFAEVPLVLRYDLKIGRSKMKITSTVIRYLSLMRQAIAYRPAPALKRER